MLVGFRVEGLRARLTGVYKGEWEVDPCNRPYIILLVVRIFSPPLSLRHHYGRVQASTQPQTL